MNWSVADFVVFAAMLTGVGGAWFLAVRRTTSHKYRLAVGVALGAAFFLVWINGAVGIIGDENNDANMMFPGVLAVALGGAVIARFRPRGMARTMYATTAAQVLVAVVALLVVPGPPGPGWPWDFLFLTVMFAGLWLLSARLFHAAAHQQG